MGRGKEGKKGKREGRMRNGEKEKNGTNKGRKIEQGERK